MNVRWWRRRKDPEWPPKQTGVPVKCPECGELTDMRFTTAIKDIPAIISKRRWYSVADFPVDMYCPTCAWSEELIASQFTIDIDQGKVIFGRMRRPG